MVFNKFGAVHSQEVTVQAMTRLSLSDKVGLVFASQIAVQGLQIGDGVLLARLLSRAHPANGHGNRYAKAARRGFTLFGRAIDAGGVISRDDAGLVCLEEYPSDPPGHVLNGWIFALVGLRKYADTFGDGQAANLAAESLQALTRILPRYDTGFWSRYDLFARFPSLGRRGPYSLAQCRKCLVIGRFKWTEHC
jgi:hypothetical protein